MGWGLLNTSMMRVRPRDGLRIVDPDRSDVIPATGRLVPRSIYWLRRLRDGDVFFCEPTMAERPPAAPPSGGQTQAEPKKGHTEAANAQDAMDAEVIPAPKKTRKKAEDKAAD